MLMFCRFSNKTISAIHSIEFPVSARRYKKFQFGARKGIAPITTARGELTYCKQNTLLEIIRELKSQSQLLPPNLKGDRQAPAERNRTSSS